MIDYIRKYEAVVVAVTVTDYLLDGTYWLDLEDVKEAFTATAPVGEVRFLEENEGRIAAL